MIGCHLNYQRVELSAVRITLQTTIGLGKSGDLFLSEFP
jgi:hypothetical protein